MIARAGRADFLVWIDKHRECAVVAIVHRFEDRQRMQNRGNAAARIRDTQPIHPVAVDLERLPRGHALGIHRVHVCHQQNLLRARTGERGFHHLAEFVRCVRQAHRVRFGGLDHFHFAAQRLQARRQHLGDLVELFEFAAAGFDGGELL